MTITSNLSLIHHLSASTPRIAQKYIDRPLLLRNKKFDLRFIIAVKQIFPLEIYIYEKFWIRSANEDYTLDERQRYNYTTHFTVMNYGSNQLKKILCDEFIEELEQQSIAWAPIYSKIQTLVKELFTASYIAHPELDNKWSRAVYGLDLMIDQNL